MWQKLYKVFIDKSTDILVIKNSEEYQLHLGKEPGIRTSKYIFY